MSPHLPDPNAPGYYFRNLIMAEMASRNLSRSWLSKQVSNQKDGCSAANIMHWLRGDQDIASRYLAVVFRILDLKITRY